MGENKDSLVKDLLKEKDLTISTLTGQVEAHALLSKEKDEKIAELEEEIHSLKSGFDEKVNEKMQEIKDRAKLEAEYQAVFPKGTVDGKSDDTLKSAIETHALLMKNEKKPSQGGKGASKPSKQKVPIDTNEETHSVNEEKKNPSWKRMLI